MIIPTFASDWFIWIKYWYECITGACFGFLMLVFTIGMLITNSLLDSVLFVINLDYLWIWCFKSTTFSEWTWMDSDFVFFKWLCDFYWWVLSCIYVLYHSEFFNINKEYLSCKTISKFLNTNFFIEFFLILKFHLNLYMH